MKELTKELCNTLARHKKFIIIFASSLLAVCVAGMVVAAFVDLELSRTLNDPTQVFSKLLHDFGEWPAYFINVGFPIALAVYLVKNKKYWWAILPFIFACAFGLFFSRIWLETSELQFHLHIILNVICIGVFVGIFFLVPKEAHKKFLYILGVTFIITNITYLIMLAFKYLWGRVRFWDLAGNFTPWYRPNGITGNTSFPSGHVLSAASLLMLWLVPIIFKIKNKVARAILIIIPIFYTISMMYARIVVGAHYLSDVVFSIILLTLCATVFLYFVCRRQKKKN